MFAIKIKRHQSTLIKGDLMKKLTFILILPFLASCASERKPDSALSLIASGLPAYAADNNVLFTCQSKNFDVVKQFFKNSQPPAEVKEGTVIQMTIGQDKTETQPLYEMRVDFLNEKNEQVSTTKNYKRLAYTENPGTGRVSMTYSPSNTFNSQGARSFNMMINTDNNAKLAFIQQNGNNAPNRSIDLDCKRATNKTIVMPKAVDLSSMTDAQKVKMLQELSRQLPTRHRYTDDENEPAPSFVTTELENNIKNVIKGLALTEEQFKKRAYVDKMAKVTFAEPNKRCENIKWESYSTIKDFTGRAVGYRAFVTCKEVAAKSVEKDDKGKPITEKFSIQYEGFYIANNAVLTDKLTDYDFADAD